MKIAIIPSAVRPNEELREQFGDVPNVLIPLEEKPILDYIIKNLEAQVDKFFLVVSEEKFNQLQEYVMNNELSDKVEVVGVSNTKSIAETILKGVSFAEESLGKIDSLIINFGDTFVDEGLDYSGDNIVYSDDSEMFKWTTFEFEKNGQISSIIDKGQIHSDGSQNHVFIGIFSISNVELFRQILNNELNNKHEPFFLGLKEYSEKNPFKYLYTEHWIDTGHLEKYIESKKAVKARSFNTIEIDHKRGTLTKRSVEVEKLISEIGWYLKLPIDVQYLTPRIFDYSMEYSNPYVRMEYYSYPTLHELFLWSDLSVTDWEKIFDNLLFILDDLKTYTKKVSKEIFKKTLYDMYFMKTVERVEKLKSNSDYFEMYNNSIWINGKKFNSIKFYINKLEDLLERSGVYSRERLGIIHGDYCASNILVDKKTNIVRLIDPRGKFGDYDIYGDSLYDVAKLMHSFDGRYDFIIADQFKVSYENKSLTYELYTNEKHDKITELIMKRLKEKNEKEYYQAKLIEALLFLSMVPLHSDYPSRQYIMLATGIKLIDEALKYYSIENKEVSN